MAGSLTFWKRVVIVQGILLVCAMLFTIILVMMKLMGALNGQAGQSCDTMPYSVAEEVEAMAADGGMLYVAQKHADGITKIIRLQPCD